MKRKVFGALAALALVIAVAACKPAVTNPPSASSITHSTATLSATVTPYNLATTYYFEYGTTTSYGQTTNTRSAGSGAAVTASAVAMDLEPSTTYHYRVVATNRDGTTQGADNTFTTSSCSPGTTIVITTGGTYSGCYVSTDPDTPAVTVATNDHVEFDHARVKSASIGIKARDYNNNWYNADLDIHDSTFIATSPGTSTCTVDETCNFSVLGYNMVKLKYEHNFDKYTNGVYWSAPDVTPTVGLYRFNKVVETGHWLGSDTWLAHAFQTNDVDMAGLEVSWNEFRNTFGQSDVEDIVNFYNSNGTSAAWWDVHHNLFDGTYPTTTGVSSFTGSGISIGDNNGSYQKVHENIFVSNSNVGAGLSAGSNLQIYTNAIVNDGYANGVLTGSSFGQGVTVWDNPAYAGSPSNVWASGNTIGHVRPLTSSTSERADKWLPACATPLDTYNGDDDTACPNNTSLTGTIDSTTEADARQAWQDARVNNSYVTGPD